MAIWNNKKKGFLIYLSVFLTVSCGVKAPPLQPVLKLIPPVENLNFYQKGNSLLASISFPESYSDGTPLEIKKVRLHYKFYKSNKIIDSRRFLKESILEDFVLEERKNLVFKKEMKDFPGKFYISIFFWDSRGKRSPMSKIFEFDVKEPLKPPKNLEAKVEENGINLKWEAEKDKEKLGFFLYFSEGKEFKRVNQEPLLKNEFVFKDFTWDREYRFKVSSIYEKFYESNDSEEISIVPVDKFPPPPPQNLVAIPEEGFILLRWDKIEVGDLEKYNVYREEDGKRKLLTLNGTKSTEFEDRTGEKGKIYKYFVTAVDKKGNESLPSNSVEERFR